VHPDDAARVAVVIGEALAATDPEAEWQFESRIRCADGDVRWISVWFRIEKDASGRTTRLSGVNQDITDRKRAEEEKDRLQAQLLQAQKMESIGRLAGGVAHDFNNMLQVVLGGIDLVLEDATLDAAGREYLLEARRTAHRSADLTARLLGFARRQTVSPRRLDLNGTVAGMQSMLRRLIGENIDLAWEPGPNLWPVRVDPSQIDQILANLAVNARDAISVAGRVALSTANVVLTSDACAERPWIVPGDYVCLTVSDTGCGMSPDVLAHLFEPFFTTKEQGKGTGLGLATVYGIVKQNGGLIDVASAPGTGTSVRVYLPRCVADDVDAGPRAPTAAPKTGRETVLVVEDDEGVLRLARTILTRRGYTVLTAQTPAEALAAARGAEGRIDLLVTDVVMPQMNGRDLAARIGEVQPQTRVLFMSGYAEDTLGPGGTVEGGLRFIAKPFSAAALAEAVRTALDA
jgi:signal transduction histidine kinase/CheY-like chemotaxis protein